MAINDSLIESWTVDELAGSTAAGSLGRASLALSRSSAIDGLELAAGGGWNTEPGGYGGRPVYNGGGFGEIPQSHRAALDTEGDGFSAWCRLWPAGGVVQLPDWRQDRQQLIGFAGVLSVELPDRNGFGIEVDRQGRLVVAVHRVEGDVEYVDRYATGADLPTSQGGLRPFSLGLTVVRNDETGAPTATPVSVEPFGDGGGMTIESRRRGRLLAAGHGTRSPDWRAERLTPTTIEGSSDVISSRSSQGGALQVAELGSQSGVAETVSTGVIGGVSADSTQPPNRWPYATVTIYIDGEPAGDPFVWLPTESVDLARVSLGSVVPSVGAFGRAALWSRVLSAAEILSLEPYADDVTGLSLGADESSGLGSDNPLLDSDGSSGIHPEYVNPLTEPIAKLVGDGPQRETRQTHEIERRVYELQWQQASGEDLDRVREALELSSYGSIPVRWRHPVDDAVGRVDESPRWLILNAGELEISIGRSPTGQSLRINLTLEEYTE